ncbi:MAG: riboflavin synthase [Fimbriimonadaceae bacterium]|nr:riboflavin synthase [Fimbriimonadaceae bacterium]QYK56361.1 MAG: riboflavin synthase [Fimbriimonadaceae bacterium]
MFTGLVQAVGKVLKVSPGNLLVEKCLPVSNDPYLIGESIAVNGCCLTLVDFDQGLEFNLSEETWTRTALRTLRIGSRVNLERSVRAADRLGGHIVQGHVDSVATVEAVETLEGSVKLVLQNLEPRYLIQKGSLTVDGVSLTVNNPSNGQAEFYIIPHTAEATTLCEKRVGDVVNIEYDVLAKYVEQLMPFVNLRSQSS